jgi:EmrB/QacA subfamily drug resistance transporter
VPAAVKSFFQQRIFGPSYRWWSLGVVCVGVFMTTMDSGLLTISLPVIITEFQADVALTGWIALIYALVTGALYLPCGRVADLVGRKKVLSAGFFLYGVCALLAGFSQGPVQLILFRALQGVGGALIMVNSFAIVTALFPPEERGRAMGLSGGAVSAIGYTLGPVIGGLITYTLGWRSVFYITALLGTGGFLAARTILRDDDEPIARGKKEANEPFDWGGTAAFTIGLFALLLALTTGQRGLWATLTVRLEFFVAVLGFVLFVWWEGRSRAPLLDLRLFAIRAFTAGNVARLTTFVTVSMNHLVMPFFLQLGLGLDPMRAGLLMTPTTVALALLSPLSGWASDRIGSRLLCSAGMAVMGAAFFSLAFLETGATPRDIVLRMSLLGIGLGLFQTPNNNSLMSSIPPNRLGVGSAFLAIVRSVGISVGAAIATTIISASLLAATGQISLQSLGNAAAVKGDSVVLGAFLDGYRLTYITGGILALGGALASSMRTR